MSDIRCLSPNIILNKSWHINKVDFTKGWRIIIRGQEMNYVPLPKRAKIQKEEIDECYYYNIYSGEMIPCYLVVPCQKCILCKDKKAVDWATRVTCEGNYHVNCPWWITLTYNCLSLPDDGLIKRDVQNFSRDFVNVFPVLLVKIFVSVLLLLVSMVVILPVHIIMLLYTDFLCLLLKRFFV